MTITYQRFLIQDYYILKNDLAQATEYYNNQILKNCRILIQNCRILFLVFTDDYINFVSSKIMQYDYERE